MGIAYSRHYKEAILRVLIENARSDHPKVVSLDGDLLKVFPDTTKLRGALELLEAQGYVELFRMRSVGVFNVKLTPAGLSYFDSRSEKLHSLWLERKFNLLQTALTALATFLIGLLADHYLDIVGWFLALFKQ